jgi:hypothetical protein
LKAFFDRETIEKVLGSNIGYMRAWVRIVKAVRKRELQKEDTTGGVRQMRALMYRFLNRGTEVN